MVEDSKLVKHYNNAIIEFENIVIRKIRNVLRRRKDLDTFIMREGTYTFLTTKDYVADVSEDFELNEFAEFFDKWYNLLDIQNITLIFTANGQVKRY